MAKDAYSADALLRRRERERLYKRERRKTLYARGLTSEGRPSKNPRLGRRPHPADCPCVDCLFPERADVYHPRVCRVIRSR